MATEEEFNAAISARLSLTNSAGQPQSLHANDLLALAQAQAVINEAFALRPALAPAPKTSSTPSASVEGSAQTPPPATSQKSQPPASGTKPTVPTQKQAPNDA